MEIRDESPADIPAVRRVNEAAFASSPNEARLVDLLRARGKARISLVAASGDHVVGHVLFSPVTLEPARAGFDGVGLAPVAVLPEHQRQGIGSKLIREGIEKCRQAGYEAVVVLGDPGYYARFGFTRASDYGLRNEYAVVEEFMVLELNAGALPGMKGVVKYAPEFNEAGC